MRISPLRPLLCSFTNKFVWLPIVIHAQPHHHVLRGSVQVCSDERPAPAPARLRPPAHPAWHRPMRSSPRTAPAGSRGTPEVRCWVQMIHPYTSMTPCLSLSPSASHGCKANILRRAGLYWHGSVANAWSLFVCFLACL